MEQKEMIYRRKSVRSYTGKPADPETIKKIKDFAEGVKPLYPDIKVRAEIVERSHVRCLCPWTTPQLIAIFSEEKEGFLENVGFMYQQLDLYLQNLGLGTCWLGMGRMKGGDVFIDAGGDYEEGSCLENIGNADNGSLKFVIMIAFGYPKGKAQRTSLSEFKRRELSEISDWPDERLEPARLAPSSVNSQPWYFVHEGAVIHAHCEIKGLLKAVSMSDMNRIDMGIALAHMYVAFPDTFEFFRSENAVPVKGKSYIGSFSI